jgi:hypothetical protein
MAGGYGWAELRKVYVRLTQGSRKKKSKNSIFSTSFHCGFTLHFRLGLPRVQRSFASFHRPPGALRLGFLIKYYAITSHWDIAVPQTCSPTLRTQGIKKHAGGVF